MKPENKKLSLTYKFSSEEILLLARIFRKNQEKIPKGLFSFTRAIQDTVYNSFSIVELEEFYKK